MSIELGWFEAVAAAVLAIVGPYLTYRATLAKVRSQEDLAVLSLGGAEKVLEIQDRLEEKLKGRIDQLESRAEAAERRAKAAEEELDHVRDELREMNRRYDTLHQLVADSQEGKAVIGVPPEDRPDDFVYLYINELGAQMNGIGRDLHRGRLLRLALPNLATEAVPILRRVVETKTAWRGVFTAPGPDGRPQDWRALYDPVCDDSGEVVAVDCSFHLIVKRKYEDTAA